MDNIKTVLYVDDEPDNLFLFEVLMEDDCIILLAESGDEGLGIVKNNSKIDILISDLKMPIMNGLDFIVKVKEIRPDLESYLLTGFSLNEELSDAISSGLIKDCFTKPLDTDKLLEILKK